NLDDLIKTAQHYGYKGIEFRVEWGHNHGLELDATDHDLKQANHKLKDAGVEASCIATSVKFNSPERAVHLSQRETLKRYIRLASLVGAPLIRTFSDSLPEDDPASRDQVINLAAESYTVVDAIAQDYGITVLVETHTNMKGQWVRQILDASSADNLQVLWHIGHHLQRGQSVDEAYSYIRGRVQHVHFTATEDAYVKDSDNQRSFDLLAAEGYAGYFSVEIINPDNPQAVLAHHINKYRQFMQALAQ
ncbi:MAG: sugar phosphate isomerase/epimerase, partial [Anaerolineales bacterium]